MLFSYLQQINKQQKNDNAKSFALLLFEGCLIEK